MVYRFTFEGFGVSLYGVSAVYLGAELHAIHLSRFVVGSLIDGEFLASQHLNNL